MFNISEFKVTIAKQGGFQRPSLFIVTLGVPAGVALAGSVIPNILKFYATATNLPGIKIDTDNVRRYGYGPYEEKPIVPTFDGIDLVFYGDQKGGVLNYFQQWVNYIVAFDSSHGFTATNANGMQPYEVAYKRNYAVGALIELVSPAGVIDTTITFNQAYPTFIKDVQLDWEDSTRVMKIPIHFSFFDYYQKAANGLSSTGAGAQALTGIGAGVTNGTITPFGTVGALSSLLTGPSSSIFGG